MISKSVSSSMLNSKALSVLFKSPVTDDMIHFLTNVTLKVVPGSKSSDSETGYPPSPPQSPTDEKPTRDPHHGLPSLMTFITRLVRYTNVYTSTLLTTAVYLNRLKALLPRDATGIPSTAHRIFLACLILSAKFHNDSSPLNKHWTRYTDGLFTIQDVNLMERQLLRLFNWNIRVAEEDLHESLAWLLEPVKHDLHRSIRIKAAAASRLPSASSARTLVQRSPERSRCDPYTISASSSTSTLVQSSSYASLMANKIPNYPSVASLDFNYATSNNVASLPSPVDYDVLDVVSRHNI